MSSAHPAMHGKFGSTVYYLVTMSAKWVTANLVIPSELAGWDDETVDEKYQRKINYSRVESSIAPYLATDPDRFFGSLIVTVINPEKMRWEPVVKFAQNIPALYEEEAKQLGFLTLSGEEVMVPLDGQHRLAALKFAITGKNQLDEPIDGLTANPAIATDKVTLLLIPHDNEKARKIFNKVNRYARPTSKADNLITSDDDFLAVLARESIDQLLPNRLVNISSNTIPTGSHYVSTLATIYSILECALADEHPPTDHLPDPAKQSLLRRKGTEFVGKFFSEVNALQKALMNPEKTGDDRRVKLRTTELVMRPFVQAAVAGAVHELNTRGTKDGAIKLAEAFRRVNQLKLQWDNPAWESILFQGKKVLSGESARKLASRVIAYTLGTKFEPAEIKALRESFHAALPSNSTRDLPRPIKPGH
jgi:DNA sulfur modification protein DndB